MINDIAIINDCSILQNSNIIVYGTGQSGRDFINLLKLIDANILGFCDSNINKKGSLIGSYAVFHLTDMTQLVDENTIIIVASMYFDEIIHSLNEYHLESHIFTRFAAELSIYLNYEKFLVKNKDTWITFMKKAIHSFCTETILQRKANMLECFLDLSNQSILVYQAGKVGSTTLVDSIESYGIHASHCHSLFSMPLINENTKLSNYRNELTSKYKGKIIVPIREPISRDISQYFQLLWVCPGVLCEKYKIQNIMEGFVEIYYNSLIKKTYYDENTGLQAALLNHSRKGILFDWFDCELNKLLGIDILTNPFDTEAGYSIYKICNREIMILQLEKMNSLENIIGEFCGIPNFKLHISNTNSNKEYQYLYKNFKEQLKLPKDYIDFYYKNNPWYAHFYSKEQRKNFYTKWIKICKE